jgi:hypothetical protein
MRRLLTTEEHRQPKESRGYSLVPTERTDISATVPQTPTARREPNWKRRAREAEQAQARAMALFEQMTASMGGILALTQAPPIDDVLLQGTYTIPASGAWSQSWPQPFAAVAVAALTLGTLTVVAAPPQAAKPAQGSGMFVCRSRAWRCVPMRGTALTVYGGTGTIFDVCVFIRPQPIAAASGL